MPATSTLSDNCEYKERHVENGRRLGLTRSRNCDAHWLFRVCFFDRYYMRHTPRYYGNPSILALPRKIGIDALRCNWHWWSAMHRKFQTPRMAQMMVRRNFSLYTHFERYFVWRKIDLKPIWRVSTFPNFKNICLTIKYHQSWVKMS
jgi:hypothetical protein